MTAATNTLKGNNGGMLRVSLVYMVVGFVVFLLMGLLGLLILKGFEKKKNDWRGGTIYDPENDKTYDARIKRLDDGDLELKGCVGPFCQTQVWPEYEGE